MNERFGKMWRIPDALLAERDDRALLAYVQDQLQEPDRFLAKVQELYQATCEDFDTIRFKDGRLFERELLGRVCGTQKPFPGNWGVGSTPTFGTKLASRV